MNLRSKIAALLLLPVLLVAGASSAFATEGSTGTGPEGVILPGDTIPTRDIEGYWGEPEEPAISPMIAPVSCGSRLDWYRLVNTSNTNYCYRNAGTIGVTLNNIKGQCPGANQGRFKYVYNGYEYWTAYRGPTASPWTTCYWFNDNASYLVKSVQIL